MTTKYTLWNALAYVGITGVKRSLHLKTRIALTHDLVGFQCKDLSKPFYFLTPEGQALAEKSRLWKAHQQLLSLGFEVDKTGYHSPRSITYCHKSDYERRGYATARGYAYACPEGKRWASERVGHHRNG